MICFISEITSETPCIAIVHAAGRPNEKNAIKRMKALQAGNPRRLRLLGTADGSQASVEAVREWFAPTHVNGDWFLASAELVAYAADGWVSEPIETIRKNIEGSGATVHTFEQKQTPAPKTRRGGAHKAPPEIVDLVKSKPTTARIKILHTYLATYGNAEEAAKILGVSRRTLIRWMHKLDMSDDINAIRAQNEID